MAALPITDLQREIRSLADPEKAAVQQRFFKTGPGEYGDGDRFLGIRVPEVRRLARKHRSIPLSTALDVLRSDWHEERLLALLILIEQYRRGDNGARDAIHDAYLAHTDFVNNWDLVDVSAEHLVGAHLDPNDLSLLVRLAHSGSVWERRIAVTATFHWIKNSVFEPTLEIAEHLLLDPHDLVQKATGWMLREVGKRDLQRQEAFLATRYRLMPRTMLRYAIEHLPESRRQQYLRGEV